MLLSEGIKAAQAGYRVKARTALLRASELDSSSESTWLWLASISEYPEELLVYLTNVLDINPENRRAIEWTLATKSLLSKTFVQRGIDAAEEKKNEYAAQCFNQALEYDQTTSTAWLWMASLCDSDEGKITYFERVLAVDPANDTARAGLLAARNLISQRQLTEARSAAVAGKTVEAQELLNAIIDENPHSEDAWILKAHLAESFEDKIIAFERVLQINSGNAAALHGRDSLLSIIEIVSPRAFAHASDDLPGRDKSSSPAGAAGVMPQTLHIEAESEMQAANDAVEIISCVEKDASSLSEVAVSHAEMSFTELELVPVQVSVEHDNSSVGTQESKSPEYQDTPIDWNTLPADVPKTGNEFQPVVPEICSQPAKSENGSFQANEIEFRTDDPCLIESAAAKGSTVKAVVTAEDFCSADNSAQTLFAARPVEVVADSPVVSEISDAVSHFQKSNNLEDINHGVSQAKTILVVDDSPTVRKLIAGKLAKCGHDVFCVSDGVEAMERLNTIVPDLILLDITMPRMDGYQVCRLIRNNRATQNVPVVMISGKDGFFDKVRGRMAGTSGYITKPFGPETLMKAVETYLNDAAGAQVN